MAEFKEVIKHWVRLGEDDCGNCPVKTDCSRYMETGEDCLCDIMNDNAVRLETKVMAWAAEHPEPVYPTWWEWLASMDVVPQSVNPDAAFELAETRIVSPIPADVARKLGLKPKEDEK